MEAARRHGPTEAPLFSDGLGDRVVCADPATGDLLQVLRINTALTAVPSFEFALRERVARLANFRHPYFPRIRRVDRAQTHATAFAVVSDHIEGTRLSEILRVADERRLQLDINAALCLIRQLAPALAVLHENARDAAHGLVAPERLIVTPQGRLVVAEHVLGAAIEQMQFGRERLWHEFGVAMPPSAGIPRFDQRSDVTGLGAVALALVLGRPLRHEEFPGGLMDLLNGARERTALGEERPLSAPLRTWLARALQVDVRRAFATAPEALAALDEITADDATYVPAPVALETFLSRYIAAILTPAPASAPEPPSASAAAPVPVRAAATPPVPDLTELLGADSPEELTALFDPDEPFTAPEPAALAASPQPSRARRGWIPAATAVVVIAAGGLAGMGLLAGGAAPEMARLSVQSNPAGVPVFVDGVDRGVTPARMTLAPGAHILELRRGVPRVIPLTLAAGAEVSQYLEFIEAPLPAEAGAPAPAEVSKPVVRPDSSAPLAGWISAKLPFTVEIHEGGQLLGTTEADRLMLAAGTHTLEFVNSTLGYRETRVVQVTPGKLTTIPIELPRGTVHLNASPWAEVWIDGERKGETPIGNLSIPIGPHEIVFRHPQLGEQRHAVSVTVGAPVRLSVPMK